MGQNYSRPDVRWRDVGVRRWRRAPRQRGFSVTDLFAVKRVPLSRLVPGVVVWARVPYAEADNWKARPAVVKSVAGRRVTLLPGTSSSSRWRFPHQYVEVAAQVDSGLRRPTGFRRQEVTVDIAEIEGIVGSLDDLEVAALLGAETRLRVRGVRDVGETRG